MPRLRPRRRSSGHGGWSGRSSFWLTERRAPIPTSARIPSVTRCTKLTGRMCSVFDNGDRPRWSLTGASAEDLRAVVQNTVFYCGSYRVDADRSVIVIQVEIGQSPNGRGTTRERRFELVGDNLTLHPTPLPAGVTTWSVMLRRVRP